MNSNLIFVNTRAQSYTVREEMLDGRKHLVVPVVSIVEGVHHGLGVAGRAYYSAEVIAAFAETWNGMPVPIRHPFGPRGELVSANSPTVIEGQCVGRLFGTTFDHRTRKLRHEAWIDIEKAEGVYPGLVDSMRASNPIEVSTGMILGFEAQSGTWNGEDYESIVTDIRPDHLAILPDEVGACSIRDGCGVRANQQQLSLEDGMTMKAKSDQLPLPAANTDGGAPAGDPPAPAPKPTIKERVMGALAALKEIGNPWTVNIEISHDSIRGKLQEIVNGFDSEQWRCWVTDVFDDRFVYSAHGHNPATGGYSCHYFQRSYAVEESTGAVTVGTEVSEVIPETVYHPVAEVTNNQRKEKAAMKCELINQLIANEQTQFGDADKDWLSALSEDQLKKLVPKAPDPKPAPVANAKPEPKTAQEYIDQAPEPIKAELTSAVNAQKQAKDDLVKGIMANARNKFTEAQLKAKDTAELTTLAEMLNADFSGKGGGPAPTQVANVEALEVPSSFPQPQTKVA